MRVVDFFSGIGGFSLGLERVGFQTVAFSEIDRLRKALEKIAAYGVAGKVALVKDFNEVLDMARKALGEKG